MNDEPFTSISAAAKAVGINKSTLSRQIRAGLVRAHHGKVRLSEVIADRKANVATQPGARKRATSCTGASAQNAGAQQSLHREGNWPERPTFITDVEITPELTRELGRLIGCEDDTITEIGLFLLLIGGEILGAEIRRLKLAAGEPITQGFAT